MSCSTTPLLQSPEVFIPPAPAREKIDITVNLKRPHPRQQIFIDSPAKRKIIRAGRRGGKTTGIAIYCVLKFLQGRRILYAAPTADQLKRFWFEVTKALAQAVEHDVLYKNETDHIIERRGTENRIRAKTAWNAATLRGDYADELIYDEWQLMDEDAWGDVGAPMLMDNNGNATFIYTPPSLHSKEVSKARDLRHAAKMYEAAKLEMKLAAEQERVSRWLAVHFTSHDNPHLSEEGKAEVMQDMTTASIRREILAEDDQEVPGALWTRAMLDKTRVTQVPAGVTLVRKVVGVDPTGSSTTEAGIGVAAKGSDGHFYFLKDCSMLAPSSDAWARKAVTTYFLEDADRVLGEANYGGDMVQNTIRTVRGPDDEKLGEKVSYKNVNATRGKLVRAEPISALYEQGVGHMVGNFPELEDELCTYVPGNKSPNRLDAFVWCGIDLMAGRNTLGVIGYFTSGEAAAEAQGVSNTRPSAPIASPRAEGVCPKCSSTLIAPISGGQIRCQSCAAQWGEAITAVPAQAQRVNGASAIQPVGGRKFGQLR
jgi:hypothetical protein